MPRSPTHPEAAALYQGVLANPDEDTPRLVYADWLQEHGDPDRAEFIRLQCRLARINEWDEGYTPDRLRAERLLRAHRDEWLAPAPVVRTLGSWIECELVRGFPGGALLRGEPTGDEIREELSGLPITALEVDWRGNPAEPWPVTGAAFPHLRDLKVYVGPRLNVPDNPQATCRALASTAALAGLKALQLLGDPTPEGLDALITSPHLRALEELSIEGVGDAHAQLLAGRAQLPALRSLSLGTGGLTPAGASVLGRAGWFPQLRTLRLSYNEKLRDGVLEALLGTRSLPELRTLRFGGARGAELRLASGATLPGLIDLNLFGSEVRPADWFEMTAGPQKFRSIVINQALLGGASGRGLFDRPALSALQRLVLDCTDACQPNRELGADVLADLVSSPLAQTLRWLEFDPAAVDLAAVFRAGPVWPHLERLYIHNSVPGKGLLALIESDRFPRLVSLQTFCSGNKQEFLKRLAALPGAAKLRELDVNVGLTSLAVDALAKSRYLGEIDRLFVSRHAAKPSECKRLVKRFGTRIVINGYNPD
jgi:uncharacterized protein (TIGR02996 family)